MPLFQVSLLIHILAVLQLASLGSSQGCQLWYTIEPLSTVSCNIELTGELNLTCKLEATKSVGERVKLLWYFTNTNNVTENIVNVNDLFRRTSRTTRTQGEQWELTSDLTLRQFTFPNHAGKWFCRATVDDQPVVPSNGLIVGESARTGSTECSDIQSQNTTRCAYPPPLELTPSTVDPTTETSASTTMTPTPSSTEASTTLTTLAATMTSLPTLSQTTSTPPYDTPQYTTTDSFSSQDMQISTAFGAKLNSTQQDLTTHQDAPQPTFTWIYVLLAIIAFFAAVIILLIVLFVVFFVQRRKSNKKPVPSASNYNLANNTAYCAPKDLVFNLPANGNSGTLLEDPLYAEIPTVLSETSYVYPDESSFTPCCKDKNEGSDKKVDSPGNDYTEHSEYLVLKI